MAAKKSVAKRPPTAPVNSTFASRAGKGEPVTAFPGNTTFAERAGGKALDEDVPANSSFADRAKKRGSNKKVDEADTESK